MISMIALSMLLKKLEEKEIVVIAGDFNCHVGSNPENYEYQLGGYGYGVRNKEGEMILQFCAAMNMTAWKTLFK